MDKFGTQSQSHHEHQEHHHGHQEDQQGHQEDHHEHLVDFLLPCQPVLQLLLLLHKPGGVRMGVPDGGARMGVQECQNADITASSLYAKFQFFGGLKTTIPPWTCPRVMTILGSSVPNLQLFTRLTQKCFFWP